MVVQVLAGYWDLDLDTRELLLCPRSRRMFGLSGNIPKRLSGLDWRPRIHPDDMPTIDGELESAGLNNEVYAARFRTVRPDGSSCEVLGVGRAKASNPKRFVGLNFDLDDTTAIAERESRSARSSMMNLASSLLLSGGPANENDFRPWRAWSPLRAKAFSDKPCKKRPEQQILSRRAKAAIARRQVRKLFLNPAMLGEPAFDMLLSLYVRTPSGLTPLRVLSTLVDVPTPVALRWLRFLVREGLVLMVQAGEETDPFEMTAALTDKGRIALNEFFRAAGRII